MAYTHFTLSEITVINEKFHNDIMKAAKKYNIEGGKVPNVEFLSEFQKTIKELDEKGGCTEWLGELAEKYNVEEISFREAVESRSHYHFAKAQEAKVKNESTHKEYIKSLEERKKVWEDKKREIRKKNRQLKKKP